MKLALSAASLFLSILAFAGVVHAATAEDELAIRRQAMVKEIEEETRFTSFETHREALDRRILAAVAKIPRHEFVPSDLKDYAYENRPLPIGYGQTISQPYIVALMTDLLQPGPDDVVLEVGTGSGYQAAVLADLVKAVYTIEIIRSLGKQAQQRLKRLGYRNVEVRLGDGYYGWEEHAPFDGIVVTAAASHIPPPLLRQLKPGGRMVIPVGSGFLTQQLVLVEKNQDGTIKTQQLLPVAFVPLTGRHR